MSIKISQLDKYAELPSKQKIHQRVTGKISVVDDRDHYHRGLPFNYKHIRGIIRASVGKPWDKVYSKIVTTFPHIRDTGITNAAFWDIHRFAVGKDGRAMITGGGYFRDKFLDDIKASYKVPRHQSYASRFYYIDPFDGIVKCLKQKIITKGKSKEDWRKHYAWLTKKKKENKQPHVSQSYKMGSPSSAWVSTGFKWVSIPITTQVQVNITKHYPKEKKGGMHTWKYKIEKHYITVYKEQFTLKTK